MQQHYHRLSYRFLSYFHKIYSNLNVLHVLRVRNPPPTAIHQANRKPDFFNTKTAEKLDLVERRSGSK